MSPRIIYRAAAVVLVLFFLGHTMGGMVSQQSMGPAADAVFAQMKSVHFDLNGANCTFYGFWFSFGLTTSIFLLFSAIAAWWLGGIDPKNWPLVSTPAWALFVAHVGNAVLTCKYFFAVPMVFSVATALLLGAGAMGLRAKNAALTGP